MNPLLFSDPAIGQAYGSDPRLAYSQQLLQQGSLVAPVGSWGEGLARALSAGIGGALQSNLNSGYRGEEAKYRKGLATALQGGDVVQALQDSGNPDLQGLALQARLKQATDPKDNDLVKIYDPATKTERWVTKAMAAGQQSEGPQGPKIGEVRNYQVGGNKVSDQWDGQKWVNLGSGPAWDPNGNQGNPYFGTPIPMIGADGKPIVGMLGKDGKLHPADSPAGTSVAPGVTYLNTGTEQVPVLKNAGGQLPAGTAPLPINVQGAATQQAAGSTAGTAQGTATANLPSVQDSASNALAEIDKIKADPDLGWATGWSGLLLNHLPATKSKTLANKIDQLKGGAFLQAYQTLKGAGAITEVEGSKATAAIARLDLSQNKQDFQQALDDYAAVIKQGVARLQNMSQGNFQGATTQPAPPAAPKVYNYDSQGNLIP